MDINEHFLRMKMLILIMAIASIIVGLIIIGLFAFYLVSAIFFELAELGLPDETFFNIGAFTYNVTFSAHLLLNDIMVIAIILSFFSRNKKMFLSSSLQLFWLLESSQYQSMPS